jgi:hypothetical protein
MYRSNASGSAVLSQTSWLSRSGFLICFIHRSALCGGVAWTPPVLSVRTFRLSYLRLVYLAQEVRVTTWILWHRSLQGILNVQSRLVRPMALWPSFPRSGLLFFEARDAINTLSPASQGLDSWVECCVVSAFFRAAAALVSAMFLEFDDVLKALEMRGSQSHRPLSRHLVKTHTSLYETVSFEQASIVVRDSLRARALVVLAWRVRCQRACSAERLSIWMKCLWFWRTVRGEGPFLWSRCDWKAISNRYVGRVRSFWKARLLRLSSDFRDCSDVTNCFSRNCSTRFLNSQRQTFYGILRVILALSSPAHVLILKRACSNSHCKCSWRSWWTSVERRRWGCFVPVDVLEPDDVFELGIVTPSDGVNKSLNDRVQVPG